MDTKNTTITMPIEDYKKVEDQIEGLNTTITDNEITIQDLQMHAEKRNIIILKTVSTNYYKDDDHESIYYQYLTSTKEETIKSLLDTVENQTDLLDLYRKTLKKLQKANVKEFNIWKSTVSSMDFGVSIPGALSIATDTTGKLSLTEEEI